MGSWYEAGPWMEQKHALWCIVGHADDVSEQRQLSAPDAYSWLYEARVLFLGLAENLGVWNSGNVGGFDL